MSRFGGDWTRDKLRMVERYLNAYTTVFKNKDDFRLMYIDAFAGSGIINLKNADKEGRTCLKNRDA